MTLSIRKNNILCDPNVTNIYMNNVYFPSNLTPYSTLMVFVNDKQEMICD